MNKSLSLIFICMVLLSSGVYALDWDNVLSVDWNGGEYPDLVIENAFGLGGDIARLSLVENTEQCLTDCYALINITLYDDSPIFEELSFVNRGGQTKIKDYNIYRKVSNSEDFIQLEYEEICQDYVEANGTNRYCNMVNTYNTTQEKVTYDWRKYQGEVLPSGNYEIKIESKGRLKESVDWRFGMIGISEEQIGNYWAWWSNDWTKKKAITITETRPQTIYNYTIIMNITFDSDMNNDFSDIRFLNGSENEELGYWFYNDEFSSGASVQVAVFIGKMENQTIYMYYGNPTATNQSNIKKSFMLGDDFNDASVNTSIWATNGGPSGIEANGILNFTGDGGNDFLYSKTSFTTLHNGWEYVAKQKWKADGAGYNGFGTWVGGTATPLCQFYINGGSKVYACYNSGYATIPRTTDFSSDWIVGKMTLNSTDAYFYENGVYKANVSTQMPTTAQNVPLTSYVSVNSILHDWAYIRPIANSTPSYTFGAEETVPITTLNVETKLQSPATSLNTRNTSLTFVANLTTSNGNHSNITLYIWNSATSVYYTALNNSYGSNETYSICDWDTNRTFVVDNTPPTFTFYSPTGNYTTLSLPVYTTLNYTVTDASSVSCTYYTSENSTNVSFTCGTLQNVSFSTTGTKTIYYFANDTLENRAGNSTSIFVNFINYTVTYETPTAEGTPQNITIELTADARTSSNATLIYNNTVYTTTESDTNATYAKYRTEVTAPGPLNNSNIVIPLYFNYTIDGTQRTTREYNQTVFYLSPLIVSKSCTPSQLYFTFKDEVNQSILNSSVEYNIVYGPSYNTSLKSLYGQILDINNFGICLNESTSFYYINYGELQYNREDWVERRNYLFEDYKIENNTQTNVTLYDLLNTEQTSFRLIIEDTSLNPYVDKYTALIRWYPEFNEYRVVEMGKTDEEGSTVIHVRTEDVDYRIGVYEKNGTLIKLADPIRMVCLVSPCSYTLKISPIDNDFTSFFDVTYNLDYNYTTKLWSFTYSDTSQKTSGMNLTVYKMTGNSVYPVCSSLSSGYVGAMSCNTSLYSGKLKAVVVRTASPGTPIAQKIIQTATTQFTSQFGLFLSLIISIPVIFIFSIVSPIAAIIGGVIALIPALYFGAINWTIIGGFAILGGIAAHFLKRIG